jgi:hypothetical protein
MPKVEKDWLQLELYKERYGLYERIIKEGSEDFLNSVATPSLKVIQKTWVSSSIGQEPSI